MSSTEIYLSVLNALREPIFVLSSDFQVVFVNSAFWSALPAKTASGRVLLPQSPWFWPDARAVEYSPESFNSIFVSSDGEEFAVKLRACNLAGGNFLIQLLDGINGAETNRDFHSQRLQALGMLASGVAHDFNNVLTGILGHLAYLKAATKLEAQPMESLNSIEEGAKKASEIAQQIVRFSKTDSTERSKLVNLPKVVERTCRLLRGAISSKYQLNLDVPEDMDVNVLGIEARVAQILVNLVVNARDACPNGGTISVSVDQINDPGRLSVLLSTDELPCDSYAVIKVEDSGHGMSPEVLDRIFEPYFSTKDENGTGIGLYTVLTIVKSFGGAIEVESAPDKGTAVSIYLPQLNMDSISDEQQEVESTIV
jgi:signal transduction histidine kinase